MEIEKFNLYRDTNWNDIKLRFCGHSECLPLIPMALEQDLIILCISFFPVKGAL